MKTFLEKLNDVFNKPSEEEIPFEKQSGSTQIATTTGSYKTAITKLLSINPNIKTVLDYGSGLGLGSDAMRQSSGLVVDTLEVNPERWKSKTPVTYTSSKHVKGTYDAIVCLNVLNVVPQQIRDSIVVHIGTVLSPGGVAAIGTRRWKDDVGLAKNAEEGPEPNSLLIRKKSGLVFQKGFDGNELVDYLKSILGSGFDVGRMGGIGGNGAVIRKK